MEHKGLAPLRSGVPRKPLMSRLKKYNLTKPERADGTDGGDDDDSENAAYSAQEVPASGSQDTAQIPSATADFRLRRTTMEDDAEPTATALRPPPETGRTNTLALHTRAEKVRLMTRGGDREAGVSLLASHRPLRSRALLARAETDEPMTAAATEVAPSAGGTESDMTDQSQHMSSPTATLDAPTQAASPAASALAASVVSPVAVRARDPSLVGRDPMLQAGGQGQIYASAPTATMPMRDRERERDGEGDRVREWEREREREKEWEREREREREKEKEKEREREREERRTREKRERKEDKDRRGAVAVNGRQYHVLELLGEGGFSRVYKVLSDRRELFALKEIRLDSAASAANYQSEIDLLCKLRSEPSVICLEDYQVSDSVIHMVFEMGSADLARILKQAQQSPQGGLDETQIRYFWQEMLRCVQVCHRHHILHLDLKPANFVSVNGQLKLIDFGIAKQVAHDATSILREDQIGTLNYMAPETIDRYHGERGSGFKLNCASDVWSLGCILFQMVYGHTPFAHERSIIKKVTAICSPEPVYCPPFPERMGGGAGDPLLLDVLAKCFEKDPKKRISLARLTEHPYLRPSAAARTYPDLRPLRSITTGELSRAMGSAARHVGGEAARLLETLGEDERRALAREVLRTLMR